MTDQSPGSSGASVEEQARIEQAAGTLGTINADGTRRWIKPRPMPGRFLTRRRVVAWGLIALFTALPWIPINGKPAMLLDIVNRRFTFFGVTFLPTDTILLALLMMIIFVGIFLATALFGRVWCGWACPQTVYMEFLYRPIERFFKGAPGRTPTAFQKSGLSSALKVAVFALVSLALAHTFLAYFVGVESLFGWMQRSPLEHPTSFLTVAIVTGLILFDFGFFREQVCLVACPYGRFQSVMLDRDSLIITYDRRRGEPRGPMKRGAKQRAGAGDVHLKVVGDNGAAGAGAARTTGDCIDCHLCVVTCPTGIDIRNGLQMECIGCAQCIDACDAVMEKIGRPRGLIRYSTQHAVEGERRRLLRPRVVVYPLVLGALVALFVLALTGRAGADVTLLRGAGLPYAVLPDGMVSNQLRVKIVNRTEAPAEFSVEVSGGGARVTGGGPRRITLAPGEMRTEALLVEAARSAFADGELFVTVLVTDGGGVREEQRWRMLGPRGAAPPSDRDDDAEAPAREHDEEESR